MISLIDDYVIAPLNLQAHWEGIDRLLSIEAWPFIKADLEVSDEQAKSLGFVACIRQEIVGFFTAHHFGDIAYFHMVIIHPDHRRNIGVGNALWRAVKLEMKKMGFTAFVSHCTRSTAGFLRTLGHSAGLKFKYLRREPEQSHSPIEMSPLGEDSLDDLIALDETVFGANRACWLGSLIKQSSTRFVGRYVNDQLLASVCLRERRENSVCIDACNALSFEAIEPLLSQIFVACAHKRMECFVQSGSDLEDYLVTNGFKMPDFFAEVGPLVEYRSGPSENVGLGSAVRTLSWF